MQTLSVFVNGETRRVNKEQITTERRMDTVCLCADPYSVYLPNVCKVKKTPPIQMLHTSTLINNNGWLDFIEYNSIKIYMMCIKVMVLEFDPLVLLLVPMLLVPLTS
jgi:hypothetical protein